MIRKLTLGIFISAFLMTGCASAGPTIDQESMYILASALTKLSASVESTVRYKNPPSDISDDELLKLSTQHDPALLDPFAGYTLKVLQEDRHAIVLVCTEDGAQGLLEDVGCSAAMDKHVWQLEMNACVFTLSPADVCVAH